MNKTSLMNLIGAWLEGQTDKPRPPTLTINTWQYAQVADGEALALVNLRALHEKVSGNDQGLARRTTWRSTRSCCATPSASTLGA